MIWWISYIYKLRYYYFLSLFIINAQKARWKIKHQLLQDTCLRKANIESIILGLYFSAYENSSTNKEKIKYVDFPTKYMT